MMQGELFTELDRHDSGGKVKRSLGPGVKGDAAFYDPKDCYRPLLLRWIGDSFPERFMLSVSMNPSAAEAHLDDPTLQRDWHVARREGYRGLAKCNVADYRARNQKVFQDPEIAPCSEINLDTILKMAARAGLIVISHGKLSNALKPHGERVTQALVAAGHRLYCLGLNRDGSPKHPLFVPGNVPLVRYEPR